MEWQQIISFYFVARLGSFTKAADATLRTQSAVSQQIKNLEDELGCRLLDRIGKTRLQLTSAGEKFFAFSNTVIEKFNSLREDLNEMREVGIGQLKIAASFSTLFHLLPFPLKTYIDVFPNVKLTILDRSQQEILDLVKNGDIDFGFVLESNAKGKLKTIRWKRVNTVLITQRNHPLTKEKKVTLKRIAEFPLILPPQNLTYRGVLEKKFKDLDLGYHIIMESSNVELSALYVEMDLGICFATMVEDLPGVQNRALQFIPLDHLFKPNYIVIVMRKDKRLSAYKNAFITHLLG